MPSTRSLPDSKPYSSCMHPAAFMSLSISRSSQSMRFARAWAVHLTFEASFVVMSMSQNSATFALLTVKVSSAKYRALAPYLSTSSVISPMQ